MHRHEKYAVLKVKSNGAYKRTCSKCGKVLFSRPPWTEQRKDLYDRS